MKQVIHVANLLPRYINTR